MISIIVLTKDEEKNILDCLESASWADEIIIIDDFSEDRTIDVIKALSFSKKIKIFKRNLSNDFSAQRNYALTKSTHDWILFLDADERITRELREEINEVLINEKNKSGSDGFFIPRKDIIWGKMLRHGEVGSIKLLRLAKRNAGRWIGKVHEKWEVNGKAEELDNHLIHFSHQTINEFLKEINFYTSIRAKELQDIGIKTNLIEIVLFPKAKFFLNYFFKLGFLDGTQGFLFAIFMSFHSFLVRSKLWSYTKKY